MNAKWFSQNMREYGLDLILLDDGWQGSGRDWHGLRKTFAEGMKDLADKIKELGMTPGLWLHCNEDIIEEEGCFMRHKNGDTVCDPFCGPYTLDPTKPGDCI